MMIPDSRSYHWITTTQPRILSCFADWLEQDLHFFVPTDLQKVHRQSLDGIWCLTGHIGPQPVAIAWWDFPYRGASVGKAASQRVLAFLHEIERRGLPLILCVNSMGVRFTEGRTVFDFAFSLLPALDSYRNRHPVISIAHGNVLGIGALIFGMGHYRLACEEDTQINLTGPEVGRLFFGSAAYKGMASPFTQFRNTSLVHELLPDFDQARARVRYLVQLLHTARLGKNTSFRPEPVHRQEDDTEQFIHSFCDEAHEIFIGFDTRLRVFLARIQQRWFGLFINPVGNSNNMITTRTLSLYHVGLSLFRLFKLPILSCLDTPGADPRQDGGNSRILEELIQTTHELLEYPFHKMGIVIGRAYGGACLLGFPKIVGSTYVAALRGARIGVMHDSIIDNLLAGAGRLREEWEATAQTQTEDLHDLVDSGSLNAVIERADIRACVMENLLQLKPQRTGTRIISALSKFQPTTHRHPPREISNDHRD